MTGIQLILIFVGTVLLWAAVGVTLAGIGKAYGWDNDDLGALAILWPFLLVLSPIAVIVFLFVLWFQWVVRKTEDIRTRPDKKEIPKMRVVK